jgi:hypothetical protein
MDIGCRIQLGWSANRIVAEGKKPVNGRRRASPVASARRHCGRHLGVWRAASAYRKRDRLIVDAPFAAGIMVFRAFRLWGKAICGLSLGGMQR